MDPASTRHPAFSTVMACSTSMMAAIEAAGMIDGDTYNLALVGGVDSLSRVQVRPRPEVCRTGCANSSRRARSARSSTTSRTSSSRTSGCTSRRSPIAPPASAWASTPRSPPRNGRSAARSRTRSRCRATSRRWPAGRTASSTTWSSPRRRQARHHPAQGHLAREARAPAAVVRPHQRQGQPDGRQFLAAHRRRGGDLGRVIEGPGAAADEHAAREARGLGDRLGRFPRRRPADGAGFRHPAPAGAARSRLRRHPSLGDPRGFRRAGGVPSEGAAGPGIPASTRPRCPRTSARSPRSA